MGFRKPALYLQKCLKEVAAYGKISKDVLYLNRKSATASLVQRAEVFIGKVQKDTHQGLNNVVLIFKWFLLALYKWSGLEIQSQDWHYFVKFISNDLLLYPFDPDTGVVCVLINIAYLIYGDLTIVSGTSSTNQWMARSLRFVLCSPPNGFKNSRLKKAVDLPFYILSSLNSLSSDWVDEFPIGVVNDESWTQRKNVMKRSDNDELVTNDAGLRNLICSIHQIVKMLQHFQHIQQERLQKSLREIKWKQVDTT